MLVCSRGEAGLGLCSCRRRSDSQTPWEQNPPCRPSTDGHRLGANFSPHTGHSIRSKSTRLTSAGGITRPHLGHVTSSDARTFSRLILRELGMGRGYSSPRSSWLFVQDLPLPYLCKK